MPNPLFALSNFGARRGMCNWALAHLYSFVGEKFGFRYILPRYRTTSCFRLYAVQVSGEARNWNVGQSDRQLLPSDEV